MKTFYTNIKHCVGRISPPNNIVNNIIVYIKQSINFKPNQTKPNHNSNTNNTICHPEGVYDRRISLTKQSRIQCLSKYLFRELENKLFN